MITKHISAFVEYKFNYQWAVEIEDHPFYLPNGTEGRGMATFDFATQRWWRGWPTTGRQTTFSSRRSGGPRAAFFMERVAVSVSHQLQAETKTTASFL